MGLSASLLCLWSAVPIFPFWLFFNSCAPTRPFPGKFHLLRVFLTLTVRSAFCLHLDYTVVKKFTGKRRVSLITFAFRVARRCEGLWWLSSFGASRAAAWTTNASLMERTAGTIWLARMTEFMCTVADTYEDFPKGHVGKRESVISQCAVLPPGCDQVHGRHHV